MKFDTSSIDQRAFAKELAAAYSVSIASLTFTPKGEEAFCYVARETDGHEYFVRAQDRAPISDLEAVYAAVAALHNRCGLTQALAPLRTVGGTFTWRYERFTVALFPFVAGTTAFDAGITDEQLDRLARIMAYLHGCDARRRPPMTCEQFDNPFERTIQRALAAAASLPVNASGHRQRVRALLLEQQADIEATLTHMRQLRDDAHRLRPPLVPTHGDPNLANVLIDETGQLHLTDWGEVAIGPRERDLTFFTGERFAPFLETYLDHFGPIRLHRHFFRFYFYRWTVQEIADYVSRILFGSTDAEHAEYAWEELQPYLPIQHDGIRDGLDHVISVLRPFADDGRIKLDDR
ncbi:MAG: phosphotransferase enzyme family protein [Thermomicrobiales bacterium]